MSSSNRVRLSALAEATYGVLNPAGNFFDLRKTSEDLSGDPQTVESAEIRADRQTDGQVNTGLQIQGGYAFQLSADPGHQLGIEHAMMSNIISEIIHTDNLDISGGGVTLTTLGDFTADGFIVGDIAVLAGMDDPENNIPVKLLVVGTTTATIVGEGLVDGSGTGATLTRKAYHDIGLVEKSMSIVKEFLDVADGNIRSLTYTGLRVAEMVLNFTFGQIVTGNFVFAGNGYDQPTVPGTDGRTVDPQGTDENLDASNSFGWLLIDDVNLDICVENLELNLNNNLQPENCIGKAAPNDQVPGSAALTFTATIHLGLLAWDQFMAAKVDQSKMSIDFYALDSTGKGYAISMYSVQVNFPDPAASGGNTPVTLAITGLASIDTTIGNTMRIYFLD